MIRGISRTVCFFSFGQTREEWRMKTQRVSLKLRLNTTLATNGNQLIPFCGTEKKKTLHSTCLHNTLSIHCLEMYTDKK